MTRAKIAILVGAVAIIVSFLQFREHPQESAAARIRAQVQQAEAPLKRYNAVPADVLAAAIPVFKAIDLKDAPAPVAHALIDYIGAMQVCVIAMRSGNTTVAREASRVVEAAGAKFYVTANEARRAPY